MATQKQLEANRANAKKSTGPQTAAGKEAASRNAIKHALTSTRTLVGDENANEYAQLREALIRDYAPANTQEAILVDRILSATWRTLRSRQMEQSLADMSIRQFQAKRKHPQPRTAQTDTEALTLSMVEDDLWRLMHRYDTQISREFFRSVEALRKLQNDRLRQERQSRKDAEQPQAVQQQSNENRSVPPANWVPFEIARPATATATIPVSEAPQIATTRNPVT